jgi:hypothetical protein
MSNELKKTAPISITRGVVPRLAQAGQPLAPFLICRDKMNYGVHEPSIESGSRASARDG